MLNSLLLRSAVLVCLVFLGDDRSGGGGETTSAAAVLCSTAETNPCSSAELGTDRQFPIALA